MIAEVLPEAKYQRCTVHFYRNALAKVPESKRSRVAAMISSVPAPKRLPRQLAQMRPTRDRPALTESGEGHFSRSFDAKPRFGMLC